MASRKRAIARAVDMMGGPAATARALNVTTQAVVFWVRGKRFIEASRCPTIERLTEGAVLCEELDPHTEWNVLLRRGAVCPPPAPIPELHPGQSP